MKISTSEEYEEIGATYQCIEIEKLNDTLKKNGISDKELRKSICSEFIFSMGYFFDSESFESEGKRFKAHICFSDTKENLYIQNDQFSYHEYAYGDIDYFFDENNEILTGVNIK